MQKSQTKQAQQKPEASRQETKRELLRAGQTQTLLAALLAQSQGRSAAGLIRMDGRLAASVGNAGLNALLDAQALPQERIPMDFPECVEPADVDAAEVPEEALPEVEETW